YEQLQNGETDFNTLLTRFCKSAEEAIAHMPDIDVKPLTDYDQMRQTLAIQMIPTVKNLELLSGIPHIQMADLSAVFRFVVGRDMSVLVTDRMLRDYGVTESQLKHDALENAPKAHPAQIRPLATVLGGMIGDAGMVPDEEPEPDSSTLFVASTPEAVYGSGVIAYPTFMEQAAKRMGGDFFILPSSIHEVLLLKDDGKVDFRELEAMVSEINRTQVSPEERLSDFVYRYDAKERVFERASRYEARTKVVVNDQHERHSVLADLESGKRKEARRPADRSHPVRKGMAL
ncbi:MAG: DUF5688 family protein, partial [Eubacterium sp.]|nr:DUF5688 family protein [Eubacterium sp.]